MLPMRMPPTTKRRSRVNEANDNSDPAATAGTESHADGFASLAKNVSCQARKYIELMRNIQIMIVDILISEKETGKR